MIVHSIYDDLQISVPEDAHKLAGFRAWVTSDEFPERGRICYMNGEVLVDMSPEKLESHNQVKSEINRVIGELIRALDLGKYYPDGLWLTNDESDLSTEPDGTFASWECLESGRAALVPSIRDDDDFLEMRGSPDWVVEVVSTSSIRKDAQILPETYHQAGVREYWLIDARGDELQFTVFHHRPEGYVAATSVDGWLTSEVFGRQFRLERIRDRIGGWQYTLLARESA
jgi:Uma2 family endonuclease